MIVSHYTSCRWRHHAEEISLSIFLFNAHIYAFLSNNQIKSNQNAVFFSYLDTFFFFFFFLFRFVSFRLMLFFPSCGHAVYSKYRHKFTKSKSFYVISFFLLLDLISHSVVVVCLFFFLLCKWKYTSNRTECKVINSLAI